jgi:hypothetical protein
MRARNWLILSLLAVLMVAAGGCARAARDTTGFTITDETTISMPVKDAWQTAKAVLREQNLDLYTRDKRGVFVAYSRMHRKLLLVPHRTKYTVVLDPISETATKVTVETVKQVYGSTLLTYPGWFDRKATDHSKAQEILKAIEAKAASGDGSGGTTGA